MIPLVLITGFLGAGKTSLLRRLIPLLRAGGVNVRVILNDYADATLDARTLASVVEEVLPLTGSCICCDSGEELIEALVPVPMTAPGVMLVETNGTTDTFQLLEKLLLTSAGHAYPAIVQVALVDTKRWQKRFWNDELERTQVRTASHLIFGYEDVTTPERRQQVRNSVAQVNSRARVTGAEDFARELLELIALEEVAADTARIAAPAPAPKPLLDFIRPGARTAPPNPFQLAPGLPAPRAHNHALAHRFQALHLEVPMRLPRARLNRWLDSLPGTVLRAKGIVEFEEQPGQYFFFQRVEDLVSFSELHYQPHDFMTLALLVGAGWNEAELRAQAAEHLGATAPENESAATRREQAQGNK